MRIVTLPSRLVCPLVATSRGAPITQPVSGWSPSSIHNSTSRQYQSMLRKYRIWRWINPRGKQAESCSCVFLKDMLGQTSMSVHCRSNIRLVCFKRWVAYWVSQHVAHYSSVVLDTFKTASSVITNFRFFFSIYYVRSKYEHSGRKTFPPVKCSSGNLIRSVHTGATINGNSTSTHR
jgi:hypothetical protein